MNKDELMKHLGYITATYNRFRSAAGRNTGYSEYTIREMLADLKARVDAASEEIGTND